ncbi:energy transducer TonB [Dokdonella soli]|uniref:TonB C-terminal domain-containing protein n=1 Tax=Dokdonella soli TaxID=529810 RepID=A0ABN1IW37_9GAMM
MRHLFVAAPIALTFAIPVAAAVPKDAALHLTHEWHVSLDAGGKVASLMDKGELAPAVREPLERAIRGWSFEPGRIDGKPVSTETTLTLDVTFLRATDGNYTVRIDDARTGGIINAATSKKAPPRFPRDAARLGLVARVVVKANYDADGKVVAVEPQPDQGINSSKSLQAATVAAVRKWTVDPERVGGHGVAASVMVPICYTVTDGRAPPDFDCAWTPPGSRSKIDNGGAFALAPAAKLQTDVIGRTL